MNKSTKLKKGDTVVVLSGKDKGKTGKILSVDRKENKIIVEGVNVHIRYEKPKNPRGGASAGQKVTFAAPFNPSKVMLVDADGQPTRIGYKVLEDGSRQRIARKTQKAI